VRRIINDFHADRHPAKDPDRFADRLRQNHSADFIDRHARFHLEGKLPMFYQLAI
jgi:hypothetical protein